MLVPGTYEYVLFHGKRDFTDVTKDFEMGGLAWIIEVCPIQSQESLKEGDKRTKIRR